MYQLLPLFSPLAGDLVLAPSFPPPHYWKNRIVLWELNKLVIAATSDIQNNG